MSLATMLCYGSLLRSVCLDMVVKVLNKVYGVLVITTFMCIL